MTHRAETQEQQGGRNQTGPSFDAREAPLAAPVIRLHLWLERGEELYFGMGRAQLLMNVERLGSIKRAAEHMGMSYRAAWGKLQQSERALGVKLLENRGAKCEGLRLTDAAKALVSAFEAWFAAVERASQEAAKRLLPFGVQPFAPAGGREGGREGGRDAPHGGPDAHRNTAPPGAASAGLTAGAHGLAKTLGDAPTRPQANPRPGT